MTEEPVLLCSDRNGVRTLTLNRPHRRNAINQDLWIALRDALVAAGKDRKVRAQAVNVATVDAAEAYAAFAEKREPSFTGRWAVPRSERKDA
ncbi:MAG: hypothetical protein JOZ23_05945 [Mycobacterium sp.]|nr:hypothetical protein [Mycobacterium sp.]